MGVIKRQGIKNLFITYTGVIIGAVSAIFIQPALLSTTELGFTRNLYNFSFLLSIALPIGLPNIIVRFFPQYKDIDVLKKNFFGFILLYFFVSALIVLGFFLLFRDHIVQLYRVDSNLFISYFFCVIPCSLILAFSTLVTSFSLAAYKSTVPSFLNDVVARILVVVITLLYFYKIISFDTYVFCFIGLYFFVTLVLLFYLAQYGLISFSINREAFRRIEWNRIIPYGLIMCVISFATYGIRSLDSIFLGMSALSNVAVYSTAVFLAMFIEVPLGSIERISHSRIADNFAKGNHTEIGKIYSESVKYLLVIGGYIFLGITACSKYLYEFLPDEYSQSAHLVLILGFGCLVNVSTGVNNAILFYTSHFKAGGLLLAAAFALTLILDIIFIPMHGMLAAAIVTAAVSVIYNIAKFLFIWRLFKFQPYDRNSLRIFLLIAAGFVLAFFLPAFTSDPAVNILIGGSVISLFYILSIYRMKVIPEIFDTVLSRLKRK